MYSEAEIKEIFDLLDKMTYFDRTSSAYSFQSASILASIFTVALFIALMISACLGESLIFIATFLFLLFCYVLYLFIVIAQDIFGKFGGFYRKNIEIFKRDFNRDKDDFKELCGFKKTILEYALVHYRHQFSNFGRRFQVLLVIVGFFISAFIFTIKPDANFLLRSSPILISSVAGILFLLQVDLRKRPSQVIYLIECAIRLKSEQPIGS